jgi:hypothetical protein
MNPPIHPHHSVTIYISAAADVMAEREALAQMIAALPVTLAWRIIQTPLKAEPLNLEVLPTADLYLLVMGGDIRAPIGLEWQTARRARRPVLAFLKHGLARTLAGQAFVRDTDVTWQPFTDPADLSRQVERLLAEHLVRYAVHYVLTPAEVEQLTALQVTETGAAQSTKGEGAGHSAVILSRERFMPSDGVILDEA